MSTANESPKRLTGHCFSHHVPASVVTLEDNCMSSDSERSDALKYLKSNNADLVRGDLILFDSVVGHQNNGVAARYRNDGVAIYDGTKIVELYYDIDEYGSVPQEFRVIENGVPVKYWTTIDNTDSGRGVAHNDIVWFNHTLVYQECLDNLAYKVVEDNRHAIFTTFMFDGKQYRIIFDYCDSMYNIIDENTNEIFESEHLSKAVEKCKSILTTFEPIVFTCYSEYYEISDDDATIFTSIDVKISDDMN